MLSVVLQYDLVCDRDFLIQVIELSMLLGSTVGALVAGQLTNRLVDYLLITRRAIVLCSNSTYFDLL